MIGLASQTAHPRVSVIGRKRGADVLRPLSPEHPDDETFEGLLILRPEGRLFFANAQNVADQIGALIDAVSAARRGARHEPRARYRILGAAGADGRRAAHGRTRRRRLAGGVESGRARDACGMPRSPTGSAASACCSTRAQRSSAIRHCIRPSRPQRRAAVGSALGGETAARQPTVRPASRPATRALRGGLAHCPATLPPTTVPSTHPRRSQRCGQCHRRTATRSPRRSPSGDLAGDLLVFRRHAGATRCDQRGRDD